jgi:hypothetical protein
VAAKAKAKAPAKGKAPFPPAKGGDSKMPPPFVKKGAAAKGKGKPLPFAKKK